MHHETDLRKKVIAQLEKVGAMITAYPGSMRGKSGTPDIHLIHPMWSGWVEFKGPKTLRKPLQEKFVWDARYREYPAVFLRIFTGWSGQLEWPHERLPAETPCTKTLGGKTRYTWLNLPVSWSENVLEILHEGTKML